MLAAIVAVSKVMPRDKFITEMRASYEHKFAKKPEVIDGNMKALEMAWETRGKPVGVMFQAIKAVIIRAGSSGSYCGDTGSGRV